MQTIYKENSFQFLRLYQALIYNHKLFVATNTLTVVCCTPFNCMNAIYVNLSTCEKLGEKMEANVT